MPAKIRQYVGRKVLDCIKQTTLNINEILPWIRLETNKNISLTVPLDILEKHCETTDLTEIIKTKPDEIIKNVHVVNTKATRRIAFDIDNTIFVKEVIENPIEPIPNESKKKLVLDYSSPNIAKPFHFGHLRSTIIGNFLGNFNSFLNNKVTRLNYLGDWGTQIGFIKVGIEKLQYNNENIETSPLKMLYESYVHAHKISEGDPTISERAKQEFAKLENGSAEDLNTWEKYMTYTKNELQLIYERLGVKFNEYNYESTYRLKNIVDIIKLLKENQVVTKTKDGAYVFYHNDREIPVLKSDNSTLYLTRDIAAAIDRYSKFQFDKMYYIVDSSQSEHFNTLKKILEQLDLPWANRIQHIKFGRIRGMSTRKGNAVFLKDILDECKQLMIQKQIASPTTKAAITDEETSDILGISCVLINDLKQRRQKDYDFTWEKVLQVEGDTGIKLQYTNCRLHSLEENCGALLPKEVVPEVLTEPEVLNLLKVMAKFHEILYRTQQQNEACILVAYLFHLCNATSKALKVLKIKGSEPNVGSQRLLLFMKARDLLQVCMNIIGLKPLKKM